MIVVLHWSWINREAPTAVARQRGFVVGRSFAWITVQIFCGSRSWCVVRVHRDIATSRSCIFELCFCLLCNLLSVYLFDFVALMYVIDLLAEAMVHTLPLLD